MVTITTMDELIDPEVCWHPHLKDEGEPEPRWEGDRWRRYAAETGDRLIQRLAVLEKSVNDNLGSLMDLRFQNETLDLFLSIYSGNVLDYMPDEETAEDIEDLLQDILECDRELLLLDPADFKKRTTDSAHIMEVIVTSRLDRREKKAAEKAAMNALDIKYGATPKSQSSHQKLNKAASFGTEKSSCLYKQTGIRKPPPLLKKPSMHKLAQSLPVPFTAPGIPPAPPLPSFPLPPSEHSFADPDEAFVHGLTLSKMKLFEQEQIKRTTKNTKMQEGLLGDTTRYIDTDNDAVEVDSTILGTLDSHPSVIDSSLESKHERPDINECPPYSNPIPETDDWYKYPRYNEKEVDHSQFVDELFIEKEDYATDDDDSIQFHPEENESSNSSDTDELEEDNDIQDPMAHANYEHLFRMLTRMVADFLEPCKKLIAAMDKACHDNEIEVLYMEAHIRILQNANHIMAPHYKEVFMIDGSSGYCSLLFFEGVKKVVRFLKRKMGQCNIEREKLKPTYLRYKAQMAHLHDACYEVNSSKLKELEFLLDLEHERAACTKEVVEEYSRMACETTDTTMFRYDHMLKEDAKQGADTRIINAFKNRAYEAAANAIQDLFVMHQKVLRARASREGPEARLVNRMPKNFLSKFFELVQTYQRICEAVDFQLALRGRYQRGSGLSRNRGERLRVGASAAAAHSASTDFRLEIYQLQERLTEAKKRVTGPLVTKSTVRGLALKKLRTQRACKSSENISICEKAQRWLKKAPRTKSFRFSRATRQFELRKLRTPNVFLIRQNMLNK